MMEVDTVVVEETKAVPKDAILTSWSVISTMRHFYNGRKHVTLNVVSDQLETLGDEKRTANFFLSLY